MDNADTPTQTSEASLPTPARAGTKPNGAGAPAGAGVLKSLRGWKLYAALIVASLALIFLARFLYAMFTTESTDDAFITAHVHVISARVPGTVLEIDVDDNQVVKKGQILLKLDPRDYLVQLKIAQANYSKAHKDLGRLGGEHEFLPDEKPVLDAYTANAMTSEARLQDAVLKFGYTTVVAPTDGKIGSRTVEIGNQILAGQALMALVESNSWIIANFKEGQVNQIRVGQKVKIDVDSIGEKSFEGRVDSISPASGATFSLLPPDNATGNFTKIVQRIAVKINFNADSIKGFEGRLNSGMSTEVTIYTK